MQLKRGELVTLEISDYAFGGKGVAKIPTEQGAYIIFVDNTFPGQKAQARITKKKKKYAEAKLIEVTERSEKEVLNDFQEISGGPYIYVPIELQKQAKQTSTLEIYRRIGDVPDPQAIFDEFISSPEQYFYRNKMEYSFSCIEHNRKTGEAIDNAFALGFKRRGTWWKVESLNAPSGMFDKQWEQFIPVLRQYLASSGLPAWHPPKKEGFFRHIVVRKSFEQDQLLINLVTSSDGADQFDQKGFVDFVNKHLQGRIAGIQHTLNDNVADRAKIENGTCDLLFGESVVVERLLGLEFEISMESFFQTNPKSAERLYEKALSYVMEEKPGTEDVVMDLFCGTGTIGQILSSRTSNVRIIGVDIVEEAIEDAKRNAARNGIKDIEFYAADVGKFLQQYPDFTGKIKTIILDPPRAGIAPKSLRKVMELGAEHIIYISCNPSTQARDTKSLTEAGYTIEKLSLVDQFPHTGHIEAIAKFKKQSL